MESIVNDELQNVCLSELKSRKRFFPTFRWRNPIQTIQPWYNIGGTKTLKFHLQQGCLESAQKWSEEFLTDKKDQELSFNMLIGTGATYLNYLSTKNYGFIVSEDVDAVQCLHNKLFGKMSKTLLFTTLKVLGPILEDSEFQGNLYIYV